MQVHVLSKNFSSFENAIKYLCKIPKNILIASNIFRFQNLIKKLNTCHYVNLYQTRKMEIHNQSLKNINSYTENIISKQRCQCDLKLYDQCGPYISNIYTK